MPADFTPQVYRDKGPIHRRRHVIGIHVTRLNISQTRKIAQANDAKTSTEITANAGARPNGQKLLATFPLAYTDARFATVLNVSSQLEKTTPGGFSRFRVVWREVPPRLSAVLLLPLAQADAWPTTVLVDQVDPKAETRCITMGPSRKAIPPDL
jgi:hypothetical protein